MTTYIDTTEYRTITCCNCSMPFGMTVSYYNKRQADRKSFYCPAGHQQHFTGPSEADRLKSDLARQKELLDAEQARAQRATQERDAVSRAHTKMRTRVMNGVCPCCNRTFQNLMRHMQTEHAGEINLRSLRTAFGMSQAALAKEIGVSNGHVSNHERGRPIADYAKRAIDAWMQAQEPKTSLRGKGQPQEA